MCWFKAFVHTRPDERGHIARPDERGHTAIEAAVAAALLGAVLVPLAAFGSYLALERRAEAYAEAVRLAEHYVESAEIDAAEAGAPEDLSMSLQEGRFAVERTATITGGTLRVRVTVRRARTGRVLTAFERTLYLPGTGNAAEVAL